MSRTKPLIDGRCDVHGELTNTAHLGLDLGDKHHFCITCLQDRVKELEGSNLRLKNYLSCGDLDTFNEMERMREQLKRMAAEISQRRSQADPIYPHPPDCWSYRPSPEEVLAEYTGRKD